ncbi:MAG: hypothetical protein AB1724_11690 [Thermodesulfobacteriota bacterium]
MKRSRIRFPLILLLLAIAVPLPVMAGMDVMTNHEMGKLEGGKMCELAISDPNYYSSTTPVTVVRFASDIYLEAYGEVGALKMGDYPRSVAELGDMASMDSNYTMVYGPQDRANPRGGGSQINASYRGTGGDNPYMTNTNRTDRIHDRYMGTGSSTLDLGTSAFLQSSTPPWDNFGSYLCTRYPEVQWDINYEAMRTGVSAEYPLRIYGLVLRAEFDHWGTSLQQLRRFVIGSNNLYGYAQARPLVTSGWLNAEMGRFNNAVMPLVRQTCFQLQRDPLMDQYWSLSSFYFNPDNANAHGSFRQFWFNTCMNDVTIGTANLPANWVGRYQDKNHGFFLMIDMTDKRFSGWNFIAGVNEYRDWPPLEQDDDHYFENEYR